MNQQTKKTFRLVIAAGTYDSKVCGWEYQLDPNVTIESKIKEYEQKKEENLQSKSNIQNVTEKKQPTNEKQSQNETKLQQSDKQESSDDENNEKMEQIEEIIEYDILKPIFAMKSHAKGPVNCLAVSGKMLVTAGFDEKLNIFDLQKMQQVGVLPKLEGSITALTFWKTSHLFMGTTRGILSCHTFSKHWDCILNKQAHKGTILCISIHPSGRLALTVGTDGRLKMWNLMNGECAFSTKMLTVCEIVRWSPNGSTFSIVTREKVIVYDTDTLEKRYTLKHTAGKEGTTANVKCMIYLDEELIATGGENKAICIYNISKESPALIHKLELHENRIKDIASLSLGGGMYILAACCSSGGLSLWRISEDNVALEGFEETHARFTCLGLCCVGLERYISRKYKHKKESTEDK